MVISDYSFYIFALIYVEIPIFLVDDYSTTFNLLLEEKTKRIFWNFCSFLIILRHSIFCLRKKQTFD
jgi:hypothetical protein